MNFFCLKTLFTVAILMSAALSTAQLPNFNSTAGNAAKINWAECHHGYEGCRKARRGHIERMRQCSHCARWCNIASQNAHESRCKCEMARSTRCISRLNCDMRPFQQVSGYVPASC